MDSSDREITGVLPNSKSAAAWWEFFVDTEEASVLGKMPVEEATRSASSGVSVAAAINGETTYDTD